MTRRRSTPGNTTNRWRTQGPTAQVHTHTDSSIIGATPKDPNRHLVNPNLKTTSRTKAQQSNWRNINQIKGGYSTRRTGHHQSTKGQHDYINNLRHQLNLPPDPNLHQLTKNEASDQIHTYKHRLTKHRT